MQKLIKRLIDFIVSLCLLLLLSPLFIVLSIMIKFKIGKPVFFTQERPGKGNKIFKMYKFRSMTNDTNEKGVLLPDSKRITAFGKFLRRTSLDELPELYNVLIGNMSLVGPRPLLVKYIEFFTEREQKRHNMRPGVTGLAQVNGRHYLSWDERLELDVQYVESFNLLKDCRILVKTIKQVISQKDVLEVSSDVMPDFDEYRKGIE